MCSTILGRVSMFLFFFSLNGFLSVGCVPTEDICKQYLLCCCCSFCHRTKALYHYFLLSVHTSAHIPICKTKQQETFHAVTHCCTSITTAFVWRRIRLTPSLSTCFHHWKIQIYSEQWRRVLAHVCSEGQELCYDHTVPRRSPPRLVVLNPRRLPLLLSPKAL